MSLRILAFAGAGLAAFMGISLTTSQPAEARTYCGYQAINAAGQVVAYGQGSASKFKRACDRARRRCQRELDRKLRKGTAGRGFDTRVHGCRRIEP